MRFGCIDLQQTWEDRLERELMVNEGDFALATASAESSRKDAIQFGQWASNGQMRFERDAEE
ncbi:MAG TPA: hypothetical protein VF669_11455 [Tepidisphaeraceae bacterium]|jgi:hypothetical protein